ncbi:ATP-dependent Clp protease proteolytic subunit ClpP [Nakamurella panacisegetis]|uniref:ATP-dependent Clp protease proteolytic subunit n=1 Tax=Nakamurella panacisegetis TaxID=1090615 RepID=A0A1H0QQF8_9ACTN|nr:ATP-dependent Clp protease proteolytic subunit [Nakamurella panacisegetis]SDP19583.1 ATP-dependent Clp protease proteolytic subunit ClpP [Nakamurella panacisegetis]
MGHYTVPTVIEKTPSGERIVDVYSRLLSERVIYLGTEIDDDVANVVVAQLLYLDSESGGQPISIYLNSPGGSMSATMAIYDTVQSVQAPVATTCVGQAGSGAAVLLAGGSAGHRSLLPHARVVLHQPSTDARGTIADLALQTQEVLRVRAQMNEVLSRHTGQTVATLLADTERDRVFDAEQALAYGLADRIVPARKVAAEALTPPST